MAKLFTILIFITSSFTVFAQPTESAPTSPSRDASDVIAIYSDTYTTIADVIYDPNWGQSGHMLVNPAFDPGTGDLVLAYPSFNYQGTEFIGNPQDASLMEFLHIDIWVPAGTERAVKVSPIDNSGVGPAEVLVDVPLTPGSWNSVDLAKSDFTGMAWNAITQLKFDGQFNADGSANTSPFDIYLDNVYFWKEPTSSGTDATLSSIQVDGIDLPSFAAGVFQYTYGVSSSVTTPPQVTQATSNDPSATVIITQANSIPGDAVVAVTAADGTTMLTYTVSFFYNEPAVGAPAPTYQANAVQSMFSDTYDDLPVDSWTTSWSDATFEDVMIDGNPTKKYTALGFNGIETLSSPIDATSMTHIDMMVWTPNMTDLNIKLVDFLDDGFAGANGDTEANITISLTPNEWIPISIPLSDFTDNGMTSLDDINQLILTSTPFGSGILYVDNVLYVNTIVSNENIDPATSDIQIYPNPAALGETINVSESVNSITIMDMSGRVIMTQNGNSINTSSLSRGNYLARIKTNEGNFLTRKLILH